MTRPMTWKGSMSMLVILLLLFSLLPFTAAATGSAGVEFSGEITGAQGIPFNQPTDLVSANGRLYVLDGLNHRVAVFDLAGKYLFQFGGDFHRAIGLCADQRGAIYVADAETAKVKIFSPDGGASGEFTASPVGNNEKPRITDCAVSAKGEIFLVDNGNHHIHVYDRSGRRLRWFGNFGENNNEFRHPATVAIDDNGVVYVVDVINNLVKAFSSTGEPLQMLGGWGITPGKLFRPKGVMLIRNTVYVSDSYTGAVQVFDASGAFQGIMQRTSGEKIRFVTPTNMTSAGSRFYIVEQLKNRVSMWRMGGKR